MPIVQSQNTHRQFITSSFGLGCRPYELINIPFRTPIDGGVPGPPSTDGNASSTPTPPGSYPFERSELNSAEVNELGDKPGLVRSTQPDSEEITSQVKEDLGQQGTFPSGPSEAPVLSHDSGHNDRPCSTVPSGSSILQGASRFSISGTPNFTDIGVNNGVNNVTNNNYYGPSHDVIGPILLLTEEIRKIKPQSTGGETKNSADSSAPPQAQAPSERDVVVEGIVSSDSSSLHAPTSVADQYTCSMLGRLAGYPLYEPEPYKGSTTGRLRECLYPGDVGFIRENGAFDVLFNICPTKNALNNPPALPIGFTLPDHEDIEMEKKIQFQHKTHLFNFVDRKKRRFRHSRYRFSESGGAILELPEGATRSEVTNMLTFRKLALRQGVEWYRYTMSLGRDISNGSLYLVTSTTMCTYWGMAVVQSHPNSSEGLRFVRNKKLFLFDQTPKFVWEGSGTSATKSAPDPALGHEAAQNQCVFLRGFKINLREDIWDKLDDRLLDPTPMSSPSHPSDLINNALLSKDSPTEVEVTHDDEWCELMQEIRQNPGDLEKIARSFLEKRGSFPFNKKEAQLTPPTSPTAMIQPPMPNEGGVRADHHPYFQTIRQVLSRYSNLVSAPNEASVKLISPFHVGESDSDRSASPSPASSLFSPNQAPTTPTSQTGQISGDVLKESWKAFSTRWKQSKYFRWSAIATILFLVTGIFISIRDSPPTKFTGDVNYVCKSPTPIQPWQIKAFRPKWFGLFGDPAPITFKTSSRKGHRIFIVDIDKRDIEIKTWVDDKKFNYRPVLLDNSVDCGDDLVNCVNMGFGTAIVDVPPGEHIIKVQIVDNTDAFRWGDERRRRVWWMVEECS